MLYFTTLKLEDWLRRNAISNAVHNSVIEFVEILLDTFNFAIISNADQNDAATAIRKRCHRL
jgi:hypothetical protein